MSNGAGGVMTVVAQGSHKSELVSIVRAKESITQVEVTVGLQFQTYIRGQGLSYRI